MSLKSFIPLSVRVRARRAVTTALDRWGPSLLRVPPTLLPGERLSAAARAYGAVGEWLDGRREEARLDRLPGYAQGWRLLELRFRSDRMPARRFGDHEPSARVALTFWRPETQDDEFDDLYHSHYRPIAAHLPEHYRFPAGFGPFEIITLDTLLMHVPPKAAVRLLHECRRIVASGGWVLPALLILPPGASGWTPHPHGANARCFYPDDPDLLVGYTSEEGERLFSQAGFRIEPETATVGHPGDAPRVWTPRLQREDPRP